MREAQIFQSMQIADDALTVPIGLLQDLAHATSETEVLQIYSRWSQFISKADRCSIALLDGPDHLRINVIYGAEIVPAGSRHRIGDTFIGKVFSSGTPMTIPDLREREDEPEFIRLVSVGMRSMLSVPLCVGQQKLGVLNASYRHINDNDAEEIALLSAVGGCLATSLLLMRQMRALRELARTDALTGCRNRHFFFEEAARVWDLWRSDKRPFCITMIDLDHFKHINDTHGHAAGDEVLRVVAARLRQHLREGDSLVRMGGEEFCLIASEPDSASFPPMARRLHACIKDSPITLGDLNIPVTASFGISHVRPRDTNYEDTMKRADDALYQAKAAGRDRIVMT